MKTILAVTALELAMEWRATGELPTGQDFIQAMVVGAIADYTLKGVQ